MMVGSKPQLRVMPRAILRLCFALGLLSYVLAHPLHEEANAGLNRGLGGLVGGEEDDPLAPSDPEIDTTPSKHPHLTLISTERFGGLFTTARIPNTATSTVPATIITMASRTASTPASEAAFTPSPTTSSVFSPTNISSPTITIGVTKEAPITPPAEATEWKVIGIAVMTIALIAGIMLAIVYFDAWWGLVLALVGKRRKDSGTEDMIPDWVGRDWEFKIASEDGHRYPTLASLESITKQKQELPGTNPLMFPPANSRHLTSPIPDPHSLVPTRPPSIYLPAVDPHPLEPLFRRPSASNRPVLHQPKFRP